MFPWPWLSGWPDFFCTFRIRADEAMIHFFCPAPRLGSDRFPRSPGPLAPWFSRHDVQDLKMTEMGEEQMAAIVARGSVTSSDGPSPPRTDDAVGAAPLHADAINPHSAVPAAAKDMLSSVLGTPYAAAAAAAAAAAEEMRLRSLAERQRMVGSNKSARSQQQLSGTIQRERSCTCCGTTDTPRWRMGGPTRKTLCNACGLFWTRNGSLPYSSRDQDCRKPARAIPAAAKRAISGKPPAHDEQAAAAAEKMRLQAAQAQAQAQAQQAQLGMMFGLASPQTPFAQAMMQAQQLAAQQAQQQQQQQQQSQQEHMRQAYEMQLMQLRAQMMQAQNPNQQYAQLQQAQQQAQGQHQALHQQILAQHLQFQQLQAYQLQQRQQLQQQQQQQPSSAERSQAGDASSIAQLLGIGAQSQQMQQMQQMQMQMQMQMQQQKQLQQLQQQHQQQQQQQQQDAQQQRVKSEDPESSFNHLRTMPSNESLPSPVHSNHSSAASLTGVDDASQMTSAAASMSKLLANLETRQH